MSFERHCWVIFSDRNKENNRSNNKNAQPLQFLIPIKSKAPAVHIAWFKILWFQLSARFRFCIPTNLIFIMENRLYFSTVQICDQIAILFCRSYTHTHRKRPRNIYTLFPSRNTFYIAAEYKNEKTKKKNHTHSTKYTYSHAQIHAWILKYKTMTFFKWRRVSRDLYWIFSMFKINNITTNKFRTMSLIENALT